MKKKILLPLLFFCLTIYSQKNKKYLIPKDKIGITNNNLKIDGFYYSKYITIRPNNDTIYFIAPLFLFKNGAAAHSDYTGNGSGKINEKVLGKRCKIQMPNKKGFQEVISFFKCFSPTHKYRKPSSNYSVNNNIIRIQTAFKKVFFEMRGIVLNDTTFIIKKRIDYANNQIKEVNLLYHFKKSIQPKAPRLYKD